MDREQHLRMLSNLSMMVEAKELLPWFAFRRRAEAQRSINHQIYMIMQHQFSSLAGASKKLGLLYEGPS